jgi:predicted HicB family RNase H-like nuclease
MENKSRNKEREFYNVRVKGELFKILADAAFDRHMNLARCVEEALEDYIEKHDLEVVR